MTMAASQNEAEYLATEILTNSKPVTYHKFSRQLNIPISRAKTTLLEYYEKNKESLTATFIITGSTQTGKLIKLSDEEDLDSDIKKFDTVNCIHIYCVFKKLSQFTSTEIAREELKFPSTFDNVSDYEKNGMIKGPKLEAIIQESSTTFAVSKSSSPLALKKSAPKTEPKKESSISSDLTSSYVSRKQNNNQNKLPLKGMTSGYVSRKKESTLPAKRAQTEPLKPSMVYKSRKLEAKSPKERIIVSNDDDGIDNEDDEPVKASKATNTSDLQRMFDDDDFTFSDDNEETPKEQTEELKSEIGGDSIVEVDPPKEVNLVKEQTEEPNLFVPEEVEENETQEPAANVQEEEAQLFVQEEDDDGYIVTRKAKPVTKPPKANKPVHNTAPSKINKPVTGAKKDGKKRQASLMDFFGKKK